MLANRHQRIAFAIGVLLMIVASLYPPWIGTHRDNDNKLRDADRQYALAFNAPSGMSTAALRVLNQNKSKLYIVEYYALGTWVWEIDWPILTVEWTALALATFGAVVLLKRPTNREK